MTALGLTQLLAGRVFGSGRSDTENSTALWLCNVGLLGVFAVGYPGYFAFDAVWPSFYYSPVAIGKNAWLLAQAFFIGVYLVGAVMSFNGVRRVLRFVPAAA